MFRVTKLMREEKSKSVNICDISSQTAMKGKAGPLPSNHRLLSPNHSSQEIVLLLELRTSCPACPWETRREQSCGLPSAAERSGRWPPAGSETPVELPPEPSSAPDARGATPPHSRCFPGNAPAPSPSSPAPLWKGKALHPGQRALQCPWKQGAAKSTGF